MGNCCPVHKDLKAIEEPSTGSQRSNNSPTATRTTPHLKIFSLAELKSATGNFRKESVVGEGGFGKVFKGYIDEKTYAPSKEGHGMPVAIKKSNPHGEQGLKEWQAEVKFLGKFRHGNLVKLLGLCWEEKQFLLVYEFMEGGSLEKRLFSAPEKENGGDDVNIMLSWDTRMRIAMGAAAGLAFLHSTAGKKVIYRDFKASNILLDQELNAKISDFGLAKLGPEMGISHLTTQIVGTPGYAAPEYVATGHLYVKSDVYSFGVVLLEIITGLRVHDPHRPAEMFNLVEWAKPILRNKKKLMKEIVDGRLRAHYPPKGAYRMAELILTCLEADPKRRPNMVQVLNTLEEISRIKKKSK